MKRGILLPKKIFYIIVLVCSVIIFLECLDLIINFKTSTYSIFYSNDVLILNQSNNLEMYLRIQLMIFFIRIIPIMVLGLHSYFAFLKFKISNTFPIIWIILIFGLFVYTVIQFSFFSIFYYIKLIGYIILIICLINLFKIIKQEGDRYSATI